ncbi:MAG: Flagellar sensor histidine kinase FleS [Myxococcaceae bacterium]|nr:Flagellar sensor histidine kinase FleS [Myxococcaceae bacterium]
MRELIERANRRTELALSVLRGVFCSFVLVRFIVVNDDGSSAAAGRSAIEVPVLMATIILSGVLASVVLRRGAAPWLLDASVLLDGLATNLTLLAGILFPWPSYRGLLHTPDLAVLPVLCLSAGLRMSLRCALVGATLNGALFGLLVLLDARLNRLHMGDLRVESGLYAGYLAAATLLSVVLVARARALAEATASQMELADAARSGMTRLLQDHHDVGSVITAVRLNADLLARMLHDDRGGEVLRASRALQEHLHELAGMVVSSRERAFHELAISARREPVPVVTSARAMAAVVSRRYPRTRFEVRTADADSQAWVAGGRRGLERVLLNLLVNAGEGNGQQGAQIVHLSIRRVAAQLEIAICDDGPGFAVEVLEPRADRFKTTKPDGSGLGLFLVENIVLASGGELSLENTAHGARALLLLTRVAE